ncbi:hypothetical protein P278_23050 [Zhouia amylolytica AD3]|uniref:Uncharacterized protein n=1 Tax=Zhouia amylolytica AD3 TaxID=1286632 RepID=W2UK39_9FLAO|nr:hypothetical protein P278_23050 [Zhouia amylolytica AD3]
MQIRCEIFITVLNKLFERRKYGCEVIGTPVCQDVVISLQK